MKKTVLFAFSAFLVLLFFGSNVYADLVSDGRLLLFNHGNPTYSGILSANQKFKNALSLNPNNPEANLFYSVTRICAFALETGSGVGLVTLGDVFEAFGIYRNSNVFLEEGPPYNSPSEYPVNSPSGEAIRLFLTGPYVNLLNETLGNLNKIPSFFNTILTVDETGDQAVDVDYGDVLMYKTILNANKCLLLIVSSYNLNVDVDDMANIVMHDQFNINNRLLKPYPEFLNLLSGGRTTLINAETALLDTINSYLNASSFIRSEVDYQMDDLIALDTEDVDNEELFRQNIVSLQVSLNQNRNAYLTDNVDHLLLNLNLFFDRVNVPYNLRDMLPQFDQCNNPINGTMGHGLGDDSTLGGILPEFSHSDWHFKFNFCITAMPWIPLLLLD